MSKRLERVNELLYREISQLFLRELDFQNALVTITKVETSVDLRESKIMISVMPMEKTQTALQVLEKNIFDLQQIINKKLRMRPVPKIIFKIDESAAKAQYIEELLQKAKEE
jgi:ribosome-binding factor A